MKEYESEFKFILGTLENKIWMREILLAVILKNHLTSYNDIINISKYYRIVFDR